MKKSLINIFALALLVVGLASCASSKPSCAAYDQLEQNEQFK